MTTETKPYKCLQADTIIFGLATDHRVEITRFVSFSRSILAGGAGGFASRLPDLSIIWRDYFVYDS